MEEKKVQIEDDKQILDNDVNVDGAKPETDNKTSYKDIIKKALSQGAKRINGLRVKNVNFSEEDNYTRVSFTVDKPIPGNVLQADGSYKIGLTNTIFTSLYAIAGALKEDEELGWMANALLENPKALNLIFNGCVIDVLQQIVEAGEEYYNPFTTKENALPQVFDHTTPINNIIKFKLGKTGQRMADTLAVKMMGY